MDRDGYIQLYMPDHPHADHRGYVREHRVIVEKSIGRILKPREVVHHINDDPADNSIGNLRLYSSNAKHKSDDYKKRTIDANGRLIQKGQHASK